MATLISAATGNFTSSSTWQVVDTTSFLDSEAGNTASTTSYVYSQTFTPGAITIDGVALKFRGRNSATGTFTVQLFNNTLSSEVTTVVVDVADFYNEANNNLGWYFFKFSSSQLLVVANAYKIGIKTSTSATVTLYRSSTAGDWSRMLRTTTTQAPASADSLHMIGEMTGQGTSNSFTITLNNTATTTFGSLTPPKGVTVGAKATFSCATSSSTNYYFRFKGIFYVCAGGVVHIGTSGTPIPSTSTCTIEMDCTANVDSAISVATGGAFNVYGTETAVKTLLTADAAASATTITVASTTGMAANGVIGIATTTTASSQCETATISTVDSGTGLTLSAGLTNAHTGTSPKQAEVVYLTRNVFIQGISSSLNGYVSLGASANFNLNWCGLKNLGSNTSGKRGIDIDITSGSGTFSVNGVAARDFPSNSNVMRFSSGGNRVCTITNTCSYGIDQFLYCSGVTFISSTISNVTCVKSADDVLFLSLIGLACSNLTVAGATGDGIILEKNDTSDVVSLGTIVAHGCAGSGIQFNSCNKITVESATFYHTDTGIEFFLSCFDININSCVFIGNLFGIVVTASSYGISCNACSFNGDSVQASQEGFRLASGSTVGLYTFNSCNFGNTTAHTTSDIRILSNEFAQIFLNNTVLASTTEINSITNLVKDSFVAYQKHDGTSGNHKRWTPTGTISRDTTIYDVSPSARLAPSSAAVKLRSNTFRVNTLSGTAVTFRAKVRKSVSGDGAAYNGNQPRLLLLKNYAMGVTADTVLDTSTASGDGAFEELTGTTATPTETGVLEFVVDCDGTAGWVNIDSISAS